MTVESSKSSWKSSREHGHQKVFGKFCSEHLTHLSLAVSHLIALERYCHPSHSAIRASFSILILYRSKMSPMYLQGRLSMFSWVSYVPFNYESKVKRFIGVLLDENYWTLELKNVGVNSNGIFVCSSRRCDVEFPPTRAVSVECFRWSIFWEN